MKIQLSKILLGLVALASVARALPPTLQKLVQWETEGNTAANRSPKPFQVEHYEIPLSAVESYLSDDYQGSMRKALIHQRDGKDYVRWLINPEDTTHHLKVEEWLKSQGLPVVKEKYFTAYQTASRSLILEAPNGAVFSAKVSTDRTGGNWKDKKLPVYDVKDIRNMSEYVEQILKKIPLQRSEFALEPAGFGIPKIDQGMLVREIAYHATEPNHYLLPGFSAMHDQVGAEIAKANGAVNVAAFWNEHYNKAVARANAELMVKFGMSYDSPHSQNFLIDLDENLKPTGRIVFRDFGDVYLNDEYMKKTDKEIAAKILKTFEAENILHGHMPASIGILHGNGRAPNWLSEAEYRKWGVDYFKAFEEEISKITGIGVASLRGTVTSAGKTSGGYFSKSYPTNSPGWKRIVDLVPCFQGGSLTSAGKACPDFVRTANASALPERAPAMGAGSCDELFLRMMAGGAP